MYARCYVWLLAAVFVLESGCGGDEDKAAPAVAPSARSWSAPEAVEESELAYLLQAAHDESGNAIVVWDDLAGKVRAKRYDAGKKTWSKAEELDPDNPGDAVFPSLAVDAEGNAIAVWQRQNERDDMRSVWSSRYDASEQRWGKAELIKNSELVLAPQLAMDGAGNAVLTFTRSALGASVLTAHFNAERGRWTEAKPLTASSGLLAGGAQLAMTPRGLGVAVWADGDPVGDTTVWAARYDARTGSWRDPQAISAKSAMALPSGVAINEAGQAVAVWPHMEGETFVVWASRSESLRGEWSKPERIDLKGRGTALLPRVSLDEAGNALVVWSADDGQRRHVWASRYSAAEGAWQDAEALDMGEFDAIVPSVRMDKSGNALVVWTRREAMRARPWARRYTASKGTWSEREPLDSEANAMSEFVELGLMSDGRGLAVWSRDGSSIVASHLR